MGCSACGQKYKFPGQVVAQPEAQAKSVLTPAPRVPIVNGYAQTGAPVESQPSTVNLLEVRKRYWGGWR